MRGVQVLEAAFNSDANMADYIARLRPNHPVGTVSQAFMANYCQISPMMRFTVPVLLFIDRKGVIQSQYFGSDPFVPQETNAAAAEVFRQRIRTELERIMKLGQAAPAGRKPATPKKK
jgi:hypothetical protein